MTRLAVLADIHGNLPALEAVIEDMAQFAVDHVVVAGDSINVGPFSREVLEVISARNWAVIRGNNGYYVTEYQTPRMPAHWSAFTLPPGSRNSWAPSGSTSSPASQTRSRCASRTLRPCAFSTVCPITPGSP